MAPTQRELDESFWMAAHAGDVNKLKELKEAGANPNWMHPCPPEPNQGRAYQWAALHIASDQGHVEAVKWLSGKGGADINKKYANFGETAMQHVDGRAGKENVHAYLKMRSGMLAVLAAQKFAAAQKKAAKPAS